MWKITPRSRHNKLSRFHVTEKSWKNHGEIMVNTHIRNVHKSFVPAQCPSCLKLLKNKTTLRHHIRLSCTKLIHLDTIHFCDQCEYKAKKKAYLKRHVEIEHEGVRYSCNYCEYKAKDNSSVTWHNKWEHSNKPNILIECKECDAKFKHSYNLKIHIKAKHQGFSENFACNSCTLNFKYRSTLKKHFKSKHSGVIDILSWNKCDYKTEYKKTLQRHELIKHEGYEDPVLNCSECEYQGKAGPLRLHRQAYHLGMLYDCPECDFQTNRKSNISQHRKYKHSAQTFTCSHCKFKTKILSNLKVHERSHSKDYIPPQSMMPQSCTECKKILKNTMALKRHKKHVHTEQPRNCHCIICGKMEMTKLQLVNHNRTHRKDLDC